MQIAHTFPCMISNTVSWCHCLKISCSQYSTTELKAFITILNVPVNSNCTDNHDAAKIKVKSVTDLHLTLMIFTAKAFTFCFHWVCISHKFSSASCQLGHISLDCKIAGRGRPLPTMIGTIACSKLHKFFVNNFFFWRQALLWLEHKWLSFNTNKGHYWSNYRIERRYRKPSANSSFGALAVLLFVPFPCFDFRALHCSLLWRQQPRFNVQKQDAEK